MHHFSFIFEGKSSPTRHRRRCLTSHHFPVLNVSFFLHTVLGIRFIFFCPVPVVVTRRIQSSRHVSLVSLLHCSIFACLSGSFERLKSSTNRKTPTRDQEQRREEKCSTSTLSNVKCPPPSISDHRTVIARHRFPTTIQHVSIRWIRETPV